jgi:hypothetical protein
MTRLHGADEEATNAGATALALKSAQVPMGAWADQCAHSGENKFELWE